MKTLMILLVAGVLAVPAAISQDARPGQRPDRGERRGPHPLMRVEKAVAVVRPTEGNKAHGEVVFEQVERGKVRITARIAGLNPNQKHAIHIHEFGDVTASDATSAGGHYNPEGHQHALPDSNEPRHAGDLGNLEADAQGVAEKSMVVENISIAGRQNPILGRAVIIHAKPDDGGQPVGNAGARIGAGVIGLAQKK